ncbi:Transcription initiation factor TFIID component TAF4 [Macrophomina phaseolina MS6]|uniref:Transcription initiation factor TFIID subunit 4 n=2 Tax=Macrophomina phaseolina TaxID=35725 RepID=K2RDH8_MACPH|nr:Transcription initiation factor TFIID component TAF4 [Macrophomina phaseolina MS6]KAH7044607.1 transcription initiation factor TFIID component TAF4 family-domain-containing protein [Macrophomina phaseolina]
MAQQYPPMHPPHQPPQRPYSPYPPTASSPVQMSPGGMPVPPANKRQRMSPNPGSPYTPYHNSPYSSVPNTPAQSHAPLPFNQPQPPEQSFDASRGAPGSMGPPQRPADKQDKPEKEKATDINDLSDVIGASGIDLREEENYLAQTYQNQHQNNSFNTSFSQSPATLSPNNSFNALSQGSFGNYPAFQGAGPVSQPPVSQKTVEEELFEKHKAAARALAEKSQQELNDPFCRGNTIRHKIGRHTYEQGVKFNVDGLYDRINKDQPQGVNGTQAAGPDGTGVVKAQAAALLDSNAPLAEILTLLSLATKERLRGILEDSYALSRARQLSSHGVVPPDFADIATGNGAPKSTTAVPTSVTKTAWDQPESAVSPTTVPSKRPLDSDTPKNDPSRLPTPPTDTPPTPQPTVSFSSDLASTLRKLQTEERKYEQERIKKRQKRAAAKNSESGSIPGTPSPAELASVVKPMTKKERERQAKAGQTDEVLHKAANTTANMAIGNLGKKYSWLSGGGGGGGGGSGASTPSRLNTNVGSGSGGGGTGGGGTQDRGLPARDRRWGDWREDGPKGKGIQMRDLIAALEQDGNEKKTLARALVRLKSDN